eukprot:403332438
MLQKYIYSGIPFANFIKGFIIPRPGSYVNPLKSLAPTYIWRNNFTDGYKVAPQYEQLPVDLSNYLFIRTRERQLLLNRVYAPHKVLTSGKNSSLSQDYINKSLKACDEDINNHIQLLIRQINTINLETQDYPVAFASNCLYVLEKNGAGSRELYENVLLPLLKKKINYLHAEGVAQSMWALSNAQLWDEQAWSELKKLAAIKNFDYQFVNNSRWSVNNFLKQTGREHLFQNELNPITNQLFFQDKLNLFEAYNAALRASQQAPQLGLSDTIQQFDKKYQGLLSYNNHFLAIDSTQQELLETKGVPAQREAQNN